MSNGVAASSFFDPIAGGGDRAPRWPRRSSSSETRSTNSLTGFRVPRRWGVTWAIESGSAGTSEQSKSPRAAGSESGLGLGLAAGAFAAPATGVLPRAWAAMNSSVCSRASSSGRWVCGDFIR